MCGGVLLPGPIAVPREMQAQPSTARPSPYPAAPHPIVWRAHFPPDMVDDLVSWSNPTGGTTKSDLEMSGSVLHHDGVAICFDVQE